MKFFVITLLSLSLTYGSTFEKESTIFGSFKDGFDTIYKFEQHITFSHQKIKKRDSMTCDIHLRKSASDVDNRKFLMHLKNLELHKFDQENPPTEADFAAAALPVMVVTKDEDLNIDHFLATETDTKTSLVWKDAALGIILHNNTEGMEEMAEIFKEGTSFTRTSVMDLPYGKCLSEMKLSNNHGKLKMETTTKRKLCTGNVDEDFLKDIMPYDATDVDGESAMEFGFHYDSTNGQIAHCFMKLSGKLITETEITFYMKYTTKFDRYEEFETNFDESKLVKRYNETDLED